MTEIQGDWLVTDQEDVIWAMRWHKMRVFATEIDWEEWYEEWASIPETVASYAPAQVRQALKPVAGQAYFYVVGDNPYEPSYILERRVLPDEAAELRVAVNALTIGLTCGELRRLYEWAGGER